MTLWCQKFQSLAMRVDVAVLRRVDAWPLPLFHLPPRLKGAGQEPGRGKYRPAVCPVVKRAEDLWGRCLGAPGITQSAAPSPRVGEIESTHLQ